MLGQALLFGGLLTCLVLRPEGLATNDGLSYYGTFLDTIVPYGVALLGCAICCHRAARMLGDDTHEGDNGERGGSAAAGPSTSGDVDGIRTVRRGLETFAVLLVGLFLTPYTVAPWVEDLHMSLGAALFAGQLLLSFWVAARLRFAPWAVLLTLAELVAGIACAVYLSPPQGLLTQSQLVFQLAFGVLLVRVLSAFRVPGPAAAETVPEPPAPP